MKKIIFGYLLLSFITIIFPALQSNNEIILNIKKNNGHINKIIEISNDIIIDGNDLKTKIVFGKNGGFKVLNGTLEFKNIDLVNIQGDECLRTFSKIITAKPKIIFNNSSLYLSNNTIFYDIEFKNFCKVFGKNFVLQCITHFSPNAHLLLDAVKWDLFTNHFNINGDACITLKNSFIIISKSLFLDQAIKIEIENFASFCSPKKQCKIENYCTAPIKINNASRLHIKNVLFKNLVSIERDIFSFVDKTSELFLDKSIIYSTSNTSFLTGTLYSVNYSKLNFCGESCVRFGNSKKENDLNVVLYDDLDLINGTLEYLNAE